MWDFISCVGQMWKFSNKSKIKIIFSFCRTESIYPLGGHAKQVKQVNILPINNMADLIVTFSGKNIIIYNVYDLLMQHLHNINIEPREIIAKITSTKTLQFDICKQVSQKYFGLYVSNEMIKFREFFHSQHVMDISVTGTNSSLNDI